MYIHDAFSRKYSWLDLIINSTIISTYRPMNDLYVHYYIHFIHSTHFLVYFIFLLLYISLHFQKQTKEFESHTFQLVLYQWSEQNVLEIFQYKIRIKISKHCFLLLVGFPTKKSHIFWKPCINFMRFEHRTSSFTPKNSHLD